MSKKLIFNAKKKKNRHKGEISKSTAPAGVQQGKGMQAYLPFRHVQSLQMVLSGHPAARMGGE